MLVPLLPLSAIDFFTIPDIVLEKCKKIYENDGKRKVYTKLNELLYTDYPPPAIRSLQLYRTAMFLTKKAHLLENEPLKDIENGLVPVWKTQKWMYIDKKAYIRKYDILNSSYIIKNKFTLDDYSILENDPYSSTTQLTLKNRGGNSISRINRFDFEYKYSKNNAYKLLYEKYLYSTFRRIFYYTSINNFFSNFTKEELEYIYGIISDIPYDLKHKMLIIIHNFIENEKIVNHEIGSLASQFLTISLTMDVKYNIYRNPDGTYTINPLYDNELTSLQRSELTQELIKIKKKYDTADTCKEVTALLSELHDELLLPFEFILYCMCALLHPRHIAIIEDTKNTIGTFFIDGNFPILPTEDSRLGPTQITETYPQAEKLSTVIKMIPVISDNSIILYNNYFITINDDNNITCYSFLDDKWLTTLAITNPLKMPALPDNSERKIVKILQDIDIGSGVAWFIFSDTILSYNFITNSWIESNEEDPYKLAFFDITSLFPANAYCIFVTYDGRTNQLIFIDNFGNIASININRKYATRYDGSVTEEGEERTIHLNTLEYANTDVIHDAKKCTIIGGYGSSAGAPFISLFALYNNATCQLLEFQSTHGIIKRDEFQFAESDSQIIEVVNFGDTLRKFHIIYSNQKIVECNTYQHSPIVVQQAQNNNERVLYAFSSYFNLISASVYITDKNKIYAVYNTEGTNRVGELDIPLTSLIKEKTVITNYIETFIQSSSLSIFANTYYGLQSYIHSLQNILVERT
jgi:hypothetical protein